MKKTLSCLTALILLMNTLFLTVIAENPSDIVISYSDIFNCIVELSPTAVFEKRTVNGEKQLYVAPDTESELFKDKNSKQSINLDSWGLDKYKIDFTKYRFVSVEYRYTSKNPVTTHPTLDILPQKVLAKKVVLTADARLECGRDTVMTFRIPNISALIKTPDTPYISQLHFRPFGTLSVNTLSESDSIVIKRIIFSEKDPLENRHIDVTVDGKIYSLTPESEFALPEATEKEGFVFKGYIPGSNPSVLYVPGQTLTVDTAMSFTSYYVPRENLPVSDDIVYGNFKDYYNCVVDGLDTGFANGDGDFLTARANPYTKGLQQPFKLDGWDYGRMQIAPTVHSYAYVLMKTEGVDNIVPAMNIMKSDVFTKSSNLTSSTTLKNGEWGFAEFDISGLKELLADETLQGYVKQIHFLPFGKMLAKDVPHGAECYIDKIIFSKEKLSLTLHDAVINGYPDGTFRPEGNITRAECASLVQRAADIPLFTESSAIFSDVNPDDWFYFTVNTLAEKNIIDKDDSFRPNDPCTRAEFTDMIVRASSEDASVLGTFTDVFTHHKYYNSIREASGLEYIKGYPDGTFRPDGRITRAEAATVISNFTDRKPHLQELSDASIFTDISYDHWCNETVKELSARHVMCNGSSLTVDISATTGISEELLEKGKQKEAEADLLFEQRKKEILGSSTQVVVKGKKYYVSAEGDDNNDGLSPESAWRTVEKVNSFKFSKGDGVYFRRGDIWRTGLVCDAGVTYTAYGKGEKPRFYGSPENGAVPVNWTLVEGTDNIWKYHLAMKDVGGIVLEGGKTVAEKIAPRFLNGVFYETDSEKEFDFRTGLSENLTFFCDIRKKDQKHPDAIGYIYLRCDAGNPGEIFSDIEFITGGHGIYFPKADTVIDNLCAMYCHGGINGSSNVINATIQWCEVGYIGGHLQGYDIFSGSSGKPTRYGNGINFYGACDGYYVYNNYVHDVYDAGISNQYEKGGTNAIRNDNIKYYGNVIERCNYGIEYFMGVADSYVERIMTNMHIDGNIIRDTGYGFGRKNPTAAAAIKGWDHNNHAENFTITNNIFCRSYAYLYHIGAAYTDWLPSFSGNVYLQYAGKIFGKYGKNPTRQYMFTLGARDEISAVLSEEDSEFYFIAE